MAKFKMLSFWQKDILWHQTSSYQDVSVKAVEQVEFPVPAGLQIIFQAIGYFTP